MTGHPSDEGFLTPFVTLAQAMPDRIYAIFDGNPLTFGRLDKMSNSLCRWLKQQGVQQGDHVAVMAANSPVVLALLFGLAKAGSVWVPLNTRSLGDNLAYVLDHSQPKLVVADNELVEVIESCGAELINAELATISQMLAAMDEDTQPGSVLTGPDAPYAIMYTSGTTGRPKGVIVSHRMLRLSGDAVALVSAAQDGDVMHMWEPLFHIGGAQMIVMPLIRAVTLNFSSRFSASRF